MSLRQEHSVVLHYHPVIRGLLFFVLDLLHTSGGELFLRNCKHKYVMLWFVNFAHSWRWIKVIHVSSKSFLMDCLLLYAVVVLMSDIAFYYINVVVSFIITPHPRATMLHIQIICSEMTTLRAMSFYYMEVLSRSLNFFTMAWWPSSYSYLQPWEPEISRCCDTVWYYFFFFHGQRVCFGSWFYDLFQMKTSLTMGPDRLSLCLIFTLKIEAEKTSERRLKTPRRRIHFNTTKYVCELRYEFHLK